MGRPYKSIVVGQSLANSVFHLDSSWEAGYG